MTKGRSVVVLLVLAGILWILASQAWGSAEAGTPGPAGVAEVTGDEPTSHPVLTACAAIVAVASLLLAMLGRVGRIIVCVLLAAVGVGAAVTALTSAGSGPSVVLTAAVGAAIAGVAVWTAVASRTWRVTSRYDRQTAAGAAAGAGADAGDDPAAAWDALSRGEDPS